ncbi:ATP-grasp domain-containing protein [Ktedonobacter sp. SOSP1-85]|uniref:ATP-grasp domain-containing protein n=1 Tax=Ktedonobacter sp. SOSP1-85 TaxID=2778367 RepID=UPI001915ABA2
MIAHKLSWALLDAPPNWLLHLPIPYKKRVIEYTTLAEARKLSQARFVKPALEKLFAATVYPSGVHLFEESEGLAEATPVLVSEPVEWDIEFRFFVLEQRVTTFSSYWRGNRPTRLDDGTWQAESAEIEEARHFIDSLLADSRVQIPPAIVIDAGKIRDRGWAVIEANAAWAAGIYGCDPLQILPVLEHACIHRTQLTPELVVWESNRNAKRAR